MKLAEVEIISELHPIEGADKIELARVQGWQSVVKKGDYKVGDVVIFVPIDTVLEPQPWNSFLHDKNDPSKPIRVKTAKLRGTISQGVIFPKEILMNYDTEPGFVPQVGDDVSALLGITKYQKPIPIDLNFQMGGDFPTHLVSKTDEDNLKSNIKVLDELKEADYVEATLKIDGTSATFICTPKGDFIVCSRNYRIIETDTCTYWKMANKYRIEECLTTGFCAQGEIAGPGIQGNPAGLSEVSLFMFNLINTDTQAAYSWCRNYERSFGIPGVPIVKTWQKEEFADMTIDSLQEYANTLTYQNNKPAEGIVLRGMKDGKIMRSKVLLKMLSVKIINQNYKD